MKTRILMSVLAIGLSIALIGGATMAWFTDDADVPEATFTAGTVEVSVDGPEIDLDGFVVDNVNPGDSTTVSWDFINKGTKAAQLKVTLYKGWFIEVSDYNVSEDRLDRLFEEFGVNSIENLEKKLTYDVLELQNEEDWEVEEFDDHWELYYVGALEGGIPGTFSDADEEARTVTLTFNLDFDGESLNNAYMGAKYVLGSEGSKVEAIQASHDAPKENGWGGPFEEE
jgi:predicted ribosomally synthesized peptide with SipW-like signal peptide